MPRTDKLSTDDKPSKLYVGVDNGVSGSIGVICDSAHYVDDAWMHKTPTRRTLNYTKSEQWLSRIDVPRLRDLLRTFMGMGPVFCIIERPMVNPGRFKATTSALRALEATLIVLEAAGAPYQYIDSKEWQKEFLPNIKGPEKLKRASMEVSIRLFPHLREDIQKHKDGDGLLIAEYARRKGL